MYVRLSFYMCASVWLGHSASPHIFLIYKQFPRKTRFSLSLSLFFCRLVCFYVCSSIRLYLFICLCAWVHLYIPLFARLSLYPYALSQSVLVGLSIRMYVYMSACLSVCLSFSESVSLSPCLAVCLPLCSSVCLSIILIHVLPSADRSVSFVINWGNKQHSKAFSPPIVIHHPSSISRAHCRIPSLTILRTRASEPIADPLQEALLSS